MIIVVLIYTLTPLLSIVFPVIKLPTNAPTPNAIRPVNAIYIFFLSSQSLSSIVLENIIIKLAIVKDIEKPTIMVKGTTSKYFFVKMSLKVSFM
jgi:hypothetical protein